MDGQKIACDKCQQYKIYVSNYETVPVCQLIVLLISLVCICYKPRQLTEQFVFSIYTLLAQWACHTPASD